MTPQHHPIDRSIVARNTRRAGFTLKELIVVFAIMILLMSLLLPVLSSVRGRARAAVCATNLKSIGEAFMTLRADRAGALTSTIAVQAWSAELLPYLGEKHQALQCTEGTTNAYQRMDLASFYLDWGTYGKVPLKEGEWMLKLSDEQVSTAKAMGKLVERATWRRTDTPPPPSYVPGANPKRYWFYCEDFYTDADWEDEYILVEETSNDTATLTFYKGGRSRKCDFGGPDGSLLINLQSQGSEKANVNAVPTSYGMNGIANDLATKRNAILVLDYYKMVADVAGATPQDDWTIDAPGNPFARHNGLLNMVMYDGSVKAEMSPLTIAPVGGALVTWWGK